MSTKPEIHGGRFFYLAAMRQAGSYFASALTVETSEIAASSRNNRIDGASCYLVKEKAGIGACRRDAGCNAGEAKARNASPAEVEATKYAGQAFST